MMWALRVIGDGTIKKAMDVKRGDLSGPREERAGVRGCVWAMTWG